MEDKIKSKLLTSVAIIALIAAIIAVVTGCIAVIGNLKITDGCLYRYGNSAGDQTLTNTVILRADGNYSTIISTSGGATLNNNQYGHWLNTNLDVSNSTDIKLQVSGNVSLCRAYIPNYNLQSNQNTDKAGALIAIPRLEEVSTKPVSLIMDARIDEWRNITEIFPNDQVIVSLSPNLAPIPAINGQNTSNTAIATVYDAFADSLITADCTQGKTSYSSICGRYSRYSTSSGAPYTSGCSKKSNCTTSDPNCYTPILSSVPEAYQDDGYYTYPWSNNIDQLSANLTPSCTNESEYNFINGIYQGQRYFWYSASNAAGLLYRYDTQVLPTNGSSIGSNYQFASINSSTVNYSSTKAGRLNLKNASQAGIYGQPIILNQTYPASGGINYLQYRLLDDDGAYTDNTGGYVLNIKQTKCRRENGQVISDSYQNRGQLQYVIASSARNPNSTAFSAKDIVLDANGNGSISVPDGSTGFLWLKIANDPLAYHDSFGQYTVKYSTSIQTTSFITKIIAPLFDQIKGKINDVSLSVFKNMTCYGSDKANCSNLFNYIRALLVLYITIYALMFVLGLTQINQQDLVIRIAKIGVVAGLINEKTFNFFNNYLFNFITGFSDQMIANMSGYSLFSSNNVITNPLMFMDALLSKIFFNQTFFVQLLALFSAGLSGIGYFVMIFVALSILLIASFRAIAIYLMAYFAISILIGLSPLFLSFMLFGVTKELFNNWVKYLVKYMFEPFILLAGLIILTQLFTIYLDLVINYSVCWKCAIPIKLPFANLPGIPASFGNIELFCINWFSFWGYDTSSGSMGLNIQNLIALIIIAYCMHGFTDLCSSIVSQLTTSANAPSAIDMGTRVISGIKALVPSGQKKDDEQYSKAVNSEQDATSARREPNNSAIDSSSGASDKFGGKS